MYSFVVFLCLTQISFQIVCRKQHLLEMRLARSELIGRCHEIFLTELQRITCESFCLLVIAV